jgi:hypothetical protein
MQRYELWRPFLDASDQIPGFLLLVAISQRVGNLAETMEEVPNILSPVAHWKEPVREELFRILCLVSLLIGGLSRPGQDALWVSDEDPVLANDSRMKEISPLFGRLASGMVQHQIVDRGVGSHHRSR